MGAHAAGYGHLVAKYDLRATPHWCTSLIDTAVRGRTTALVGAQRVQRFEPRYAPGESLQAQLEFALRYEGVNLQILALLFAKTGAREISAWLHATPTSKYARRAAFLYEFLTARELPVERQVRGNYVPLLDPEDYVVAANPRREPRFRMIDNLPGDSRFCPLVRKTAAIKAFAAKDLRARIRETLARYDAPLLARAANYLYLKETQSSYEIEREKPAPGKAARFADLLKSAADEDRPLSEALLVELQNAILDPRFHEFQYRTKQNWIGDALGHYRRIELVPPRPDDVPGLMDGLVAFANRHLGAEPSLDPIALAASVAFGFVFVHPFMDGNGRIHRFLIHRLLAGCGFTPKGFVLPVSAVMLANLEHYRLALQSFSRPVLELTQFTPDAPDAPAKGNDAVYFRYFDATPQTEFLWFALERTVEHDLEQEIRFLFHYDRAYRELNELFDWPKGALETFIRVLHQNGGTLSRRKHADLFAYLTDEEVRRFEAVFADAFELENRALAPRN
jgi:Fic family protein